MIAASAHAGVVGKGHPTAFLAIEVDHGKVFAFALAPAILQGAVEKLHTLALSLGVRPDLAYRPLDTLSRATARDPGHRKHLAPLEWRGHQRPPSKHLEEVLAQDNDAGAAAAITPAAPAKAQVRERKPRAVLTPAHIDEAWREWSSGRTTIKELADRLGCRGARLRLRFVIAHGDRALVCGRLWQRLGRLLDRDRRAALITARMAKHFPDEGAHR